MVTLQDISFRLLKPVKELADWNFPLSEILEEYYMLLEEPCDVNFGEAALVLQNSANVYIRRVECLFDEAMCMNQAFINHESEEISKLKNERKNRSRVYIDLDNFKILDLSKEIGKNINIKNRPDAQKSIKLLSRRFTQLESDTSQSDIPLQIFDVYGEVIGKKYDFRCNQQLSVNGTLVDELVPAEFQCNLPVEEEENSSLILTEVNEERSKISRCSFNTSDNENNDNFNEINTEENEHDTQEKSTSQNKTDSNVNDLNMRNDSLDIDSGYLSGSPQETACIPKRRSQRFKNMTSMVNDVHGKTHEAVPLTCDMSHITHNKTNQFKVPYRISLFKSRNETKKQKSVSKVGKRRCLTKTLPDKSNIIHKETTECSPIRSSFISLDTGKFEEFERVFANSLKRKAFHICQYQAVTNDTMDLLGYQFCTTNEEPFTNIFTHNSDAVSNASSASSTIDPESRCATPFDTALQCPSLINECPQVDTPCSALDYQNLITNRMKKIVEESDVRTELENSVAKWHEYLQPKLIETEERSTFRMHDYTSRIVKSLETINKQRINFDTIVDGEPPCEVARYFLATLQLANNYNVDINTSEKNNSDIELTLLNDDKNNGT